LRNGRIGFAWRNAERAEYRLGRPRRSGSLLARRAAIHNGSQAVWAPLAANQLIQLKLADMQTEISLGLQSVIRATRLKQQGEHVPQTI
jgi:alkylation response protein AidB-like acyl-CoA dehydrogenase